jgi:hypothetical protein
MRISGFALKGTTMNKDLWTYRETVSSEAITGFAVEATDGSIGYVNASSTDIGVGYLVVDTGPWITGSKVIIPAGTVSEVDLVDEKVYVDLSRDQIKSAPQYENEPDRNYLSALTTYYGPFHSPLN